MQADGSIFLHTYVMLTVEARLKNSNDYGFLVGSSSKLNWTYYEPFSIVITLDSRLSGPQLASTCQHLDIIQHRIFITFSGGGGGGGGVN